MEQTEDTFKIAYGDMEPGPGKNSGDKAKLFGGPQSSLFMAFKRDTGQVNPAYQDDDSDDGNDSVNSDHECDSSSMETEDNGSNRLSTDSSLRRSDSSEQIPNGKIAANGGKGFRVGFETIEPQTTAPPQPRSQSKKKKEKKQWDRFITESKGNFSQENNEFWERVFIITKIIVIIILFAMILGTAVINKICFFVITANMFPPDLNSDAMNVLKSANNTLTYTNVKGTNVMWIWALTLMIGAPHFFTFLGSFWKLVFQMAGRNTPSCQTLLSVLLVETIHSTGVSVMAFIVVPNMDPVSGVLFCLSVGLVPGVLNTVYPIEKLKQTMTEKTGTQCRQPGLSSGCSRAIGIFAVIGQLGAIGLWCFHLWISFGEKFEDIGYVICVLAAPVCTSIYSWENYVTQGTRTSTGLPKLTRDIRKCRTKLTFLTSIWKMGLTIVIPIGIYGIHCDSGTKCVDTLYYHNDGAKLESGFGNTVLVSTKDFGSCNSHLPFIVASIGVLCSGMCFKLCKVACKIMTQIVDMTLPLLLATPAAIGIILGMYTGWITTDGTGCALPFPLWNDAEDLTTYFTTLSHGYKLWIPILAGFVGYVSFILVTIHMWLPGKERLQTTLRLFVQPLYCGLFSDQSLLLNRRREEKVRIDDAVKEHRRDVLSDMPLNEGVEDMEDMLSHKDIYRTSDTPFIYMCATMWHETEVEMTQLLKSIFRMDEDQITRKHTQFLVNRRDPDFYEFEAHIFFDDAFESHKVEQYDFTVNKYVKMLIRNVRVSASSVHGVNFKLPEPKKIPTPYGGRLVWTMPGGNKLIAHLKDKTVIRHRKRWSQVMYMYYFLAFQLFKKFTKKKQLQKRANNTFLLALDGDVDFQPGAVQLLVDRMRKNPSVGAACGRIHPIGNGAMVWYQKFEYAVSHWLQKAAEDKLGCVLCSPGCFSLFRGSALMDDNVMNRYTAPPTEPRHHVQYDQGEDRWLCTLLLQQGHRVEYCAASDALTYAPEGFYEFFNQRRRWTPSTMANIMDLLTDWKNVTKKNPEISLIYIFYQGLLMVSSILAPGTIFLMILGAINMAYPTVDLWMALGLNAVPIAILVLLCFCAKTNTQLLYSAILSTLYSLVMMIVIVGLLQQAAKFGACSITTMFIIFVAGVFVLAAFIHPQEFWCIIHGFLYFLAIPSMSMVLMIFSLGNLDNVSWGTRENTTAAEKKEESETQKKLRGAVGFFTNCFGGNSNNQTQVEDMRLRAILDRLEGMEHSIHQLSEFGSSRASLVPRAGSPFDQLSRPRTPIMIGEENSLKFSELATVLEGGTRENPMYKDIQVVRDRMVNPYWMEEDKDIMHFKQEVIPEDEVKFWDELIEEYLKPLESNRETEREMKAALTELKNKVCLIFILINSLFIIIVFSLQQVVSSDGSLAVKLWCAKGEDVGSGQKIEPISVAFTLVFGVLLFVQTICMLMHRIATLLHICASTELFKKKRKIDLRQMDPEAGNDDEPPPETRELSYDAVYAMVRDMQKDQDVDSISIASESSYAPSNVDEEEDAERRRKEAKSRMRNITKRRNKVQGNTLGANFRKNFIRLQEVIKDDQGEEDAELDIDRKTRSLQLQTRFNRFSFKSMKTLAHVTQNKGLKREITARNVRAKRRWTSAIEMTKLQNIQGGKTSGNAMSSLVKAVVSHKASMQSQIDEIDTVYEEITPIHIDLNESKENVGQNKRQRKIGKFDLPTEYEEDIAIVHETRHQSLKSKHFDPPPYAEFREDTVVNDKTGTETEESNRADETEPVYSLVHRPSQSSPNDIHVDESNCADETKPVYSLVHRPSPSSPNDIQEDGEENINNEDIESKL